MPFGLPRRSDLAALAGTGLYLWLSIVLRGLPAPVRRGRGRTFASDSRPSSPDSIRRELYRARAVKMPESEHRLDYAEHGFWGLFAQRVERSARGGLQSMGHRLDRRRLFRRLRRRREDAAQFVVGPQISSPILLGRSAARP